MKKRLKWLFELLARLGKALATLRGTSISEVSDDTNLIWDDGEPDSERKKAR